MRTSFVENVIDSLRKMNARLATVESCTGGLLASRLTDVPGASDVFFGGWVTYDNRSKEQIGVPAELLRRHGAVSQEVAALLAEEGLVRLEEGLGIGGRGHPLFCVATTGIAGPSGGSAEKPVGTCWIAVAHAGKQTLTLLPKVHSSYDRLANKKYFAEEALKLILQACAPNSA